MKKIEWTKKRIFQAVYWGIFALMFLIAVVVFRQDGIYMETGAISEKIERGKHTTRHSELFFVETDTFVMDTPGFSSMFVENMKPEELQNYFPEFDPFIPDCRFLGCAHFGERECGVKYAVKKGKIAASRYENYRLVYEELKNKRRY